MERHDIIEEQHDSMIGGRIFSMERHDIIEERHDSMIERRIFSMERYYPRVGERMFSIERCCFS